MNISKKPPKNPSHENTLLEFLRKVGAASGLEIVLELNITCFSQVISRLRNKHDYNIITTIHYTKDGRRYGVYSLVE